MNDQELSVVSQDDLRVVVRGVDGAEATYFGNGMHPVLCLRVCAAQVPSHSSQPINCKTPLEVPGALRTIVKAEVEVVRSSGLCLIERSSSLSSRMECSLLVPTSDERHSVQKLQHEQGQDVVGESAAFVEWRQLQGGDYLWSSRIWLKDDAFQCLVDGLKRQNLEGIYIGLVSKDFYTTELVHDPENLDTVFVRPRSFVDGAILCGLSDLSIHTSPVTLPSAKF